MQVNFLEERLERFGSRNAIGEGMPQIRGGVLKIVARFQGIEVADDSVLAQVARHPAPTGGSTGPGKPCLECDYASRASKSACWAVPPAGAMAPELSVVDGRVRDNVMNAPIVRAADNIQLRTPRNEAKNTAVSQEHFRGEMAYESYSVWSLEVIPLLMYAGSPTAHIPA